MPDPAASNTASFIQTAAALGLGGVLTALVGHLFGWRKANAEATKTQADAQVALQSIVDERLKTLLAADEARLHQMSQTLENQTQFISGFQKTIEEQSKKVERLEATVQTLVRHIVALERILRSKEIEPPPRPKFVGAVEDALA